MIDPLPPLGINLAPTSVKLLNLPSTLNSSSLARLGSGKTSAGVERMRYLLAAGVPAEFDPHAHPATDFAGAVSRFAL